MKFSVIIPALNEEKFIGRTLQQIAKLKHYHNVEIIVVDAASCDSTLQIAKAFSAKILQSKPGRATQMNEGARNATGDVLIFLHADVLLSDNAFDLIEKSMQNPKVVGGGFYKRYQEANLYLNQFLSFIKNRFFKLFFGNEAIFVRKYVFERMHGFALMPLMEDVDFSSRLKKQGNVICIRKYVSVSARRYIRKGHLRQLLRNIWILFRYFCGVSPAKLKKIYEK